MERLSSSFGLGILFPRWSWKKLLGNDIYGVPYLAFCHWKLPLDRHQKTDWWISCWVMELIWKEVHFSFIFARQHWRCFEVCPFFMFYGICIPFFSDERAVSSLSLTLHQLWLPHQSLSSASVSVACLNRTASVFRMMWMKLCKKRACGYEQQRVLRGNSLTLWTVGGGGSYFISLFINLPLTVFSLMNL